jgi:hypothetical protein
VCLWNTKKCVCVSVRTWTCMHVCGLPLLPINVGLQHIKYLKFLCFRFLLFSISSHTLLYYKVNSVFQFHNFHALIYIEYVFGVSAYFA